MCAKQVAGLTTAIANMIIMIFGYAFHSKSWGHRQCDGDRRLHKPFVYGVAVVPIALCLGTAGFIFLAAQEKRTAKVDKQLVQR